MTYGDKLRIMRAVRNVAQKELAVMTGVPNAYLSNFETGKSLPTEEHRLAIAEALGWPGDRMALLAFDILEGGAISSTDVEVWLDLFSKGSDE